MMIHKVVFNYLEVGRWRTSHACSNDLILTYFLGIYICTMCSFVTVTKKEKFPLFFNGRQKYLAVHLFVDEKTSFLTN